MSILTSGLSNLSEIYEANETIEKMKVRELSIAFYSHSMMSIVNVFLTL